MTGRLGVLALASALAVIGAIGCNSQYQAPGGQGPGGAVANVGLGAAVAPLHRAATGCYTPCAYGTVCDESSGTCVGRECTADDPGCIPPASSAAAPGATVDTPMAATVCTPACLADQLCVVEQGLPTCRSPGAGGPPAAPPPPR